MKLPEGVYLAAIPALGTAAAYLFEAGYANFHGIPVSLIQLNISQFVGTAFLGLVFLWLLHVYFALGISFLARSRLIPLRLIGLGMLSAALPLLVMVGFGSDRAFWIAVAGFFLAPIVSSLIDALTSTDKRAPLLDRWWKMAINLDGAEPQKDKLVPLIETPQLLFSSFILFSILAFALGQRYASLVTPTLTLKSDPTKALVVVYGERWFFRPIAELDRPKRQTSGDLTVLSGDTTKDLTLQTLKPASRAASGA